MIDHRTSHAPDRVPRPLSERLKAETRAEHRRAETHPLTWRIRDDRAPVFLAEYEAKEGYSALRKALKDLPPADIQKAVKDSGLRGRGPRQRGSCGDGGGQEFSSFHGDEQ